MGQQYNDLQKAQKLGTHLLGPDGKIIYPSSHEPWTTNDPTKGKELSEKTMNKVKDSPVNSGDGVEKINVCPRCDKEFTSCSNVYRHLINGKLVNSMSIESNGLFKFRDGYLITKMLILFLQFMVTQRLGLSDLKSKLFKHVESRQRKNH